MFVDLTRCVQEGLTVARVGYCSRMVSQCVTGWCPSRMCGGVEMVV